MNIFGVHFTPFKIIFLLIYLFFALSCLFAGGNGIPMGILSIIWILDQWLIDYYKQENAKLLLMMAKAVELISYIEEQEKNK